MQHQPVVEVVLVWIFETIVADLKIVGIETRRGIKIMGGGRERSATDEKEWLPVKKLGRLVKYLKVNSLEEIYLFYMSIIEFEIIYYFLRPSQAELKIMQAQQQIRTGHSKRL